MKTLVLQTMSSHDSVWLHHGNLFILDDSHNQTGCQNSLYTQLSITLKTS